MNRDDVPTGSLAGLPPGAPDPDDAPVPTASWPRPGSRPRHGSTPPCSERPDLLPADHPAGPRDAPTTCACWAPAPAPWSRRPGAGRSWSPPWSATAATGRRSSTRSCWPAPRWPCATASSRAEQAAAAGCGRSRTAARPARLGGRWRRRATPRATRSSPTAGWRWTASDRARAAGVSRPPTTSTATSSTASVDGSRMDLRPATVVETRPESGAVDLSRRGEPGSARRCADPGRRLGGLT